MDSDQKERGEFGRQESEGKYAAESMDKKNSASNIEGGVQVSAFDYSVENFFAAMDAVSAICGETGEQRFEAGEIERFCSMITFLKEWRHFCYDPKIINFTFETESAQAKEDTEGIILSQFSSAAVPKMDPLPGTRHSDSNDFVLHAGGHVWGLDWCPRTVEKPDSKIKCEYLAVAAHPPGSAYHKIGVPLIGRGIIQIWCLLSLDEKVECLPTRPRRGRPKKEPVKEEPLDEMSIIKRPRGRPRKRPVEGDAIYALSAEVESDLPRSRASPRKQGLLIAVDLNASQKLSPVKHRGRPRKRPALDCNDANESLPAKRRGRPRKIPPPSIDDSIDKHISPPCSNSQTLSTSATEFVPVSCVESGNNTSSLATSSRQESLNINESCLCSNNQIPSTSEHILPSTVESGNSALVLPVSADVSCNKEITQPKRRGRPRKNPIPSVNKCGTASGVESVTLPTVNSLGTSNVDELPKCCDNQTLSVSQDFLPDLGSVALALPVSTDVNCKEEAVQMRRRGRPRKHSVSSANECDPASRVELRSNTFSVATSGRPETLNINESCSCDNQIPSASECILPLIAEPGNSASALHVSGVIDCNAETIQLRRRGRPRKKPFRVNKCVMASGGKSGNDISPLPTFSRLGTLNVDESPLCSDNQTLIVSEGFLPDLGNASLALPLAADVNCKEEAVQSRRRGRPRENSVSSLNECDPTPCGEPGNNASSLATSSRPGTFCNNQILSASECILPLTVEPGNSADRNCNVETIRLRSRRRPQKKPDLSVNECPTSSGMESGNDISILPTFSRLGTLNVDESPICSDKLTVNQGFQPDLRNVALASSVSTDPSCMVDAIQRRLRRRPENQLDISINESGVESGNDTLALPNSRRPGTTNVVESPLCSNPRDVTFLNDEVAHESSSKVDLSGLIPKDIALPRVVLCLAHNGKVAWDVKWRPAINDSGGKHHMGFLAVLLGNGSLEVWEVPSPSMVKVVYASSCGEGTDPRFLKLEPVFRCSKVKCGDRQSIPLTLEWSPSAHHDLILAGCHDGTVAMWKFTKQHPSQDTKPLLCFSADSAPIRALAWAPNESYEDSAHLFMTAGHEGLKFWDLCDPFRPLWDFNPAQRAILSVDWVKDLRCIIISLEDGTLRILSLWKAACDVPVTGRPFVGKKCQGLHNFFCSSFAIWSAQLSRATGLVAYCSEDGSAVCFQLTKAVDKDPKRNPKPHFLCGKLMEKGQVLEINTPLPDVPLPNIPFMMKKPIDECGDTTQTIHGYLLDKDQAKQSNHAVSGDDQSISLGNGDSQASSLRNATSKSRNKERKKGNAGAVAGQKNLNSEIEQGTRQGNGKREGSTQQFEAFPPKVVAMNRVRWNMNKGSERWLCYGGAAGIVRCQQVSLPAMH